MVNREEVARLAGVSTATVTRVSSGKGSVAPATRKKVLAIIKQLNYKPNVIAQNLRMKTSNTVAVFVEDFCNPYIAECVENMVHEIKANGKVMLCMVSAQNVSDVIDEVVQNHVRGIINLSQVQVCEADKNKLREKGVRTINIMVGGLDMRVDYQIAMREAFSILKQKGKKCPVFIGWTDRDGMKDDNRVQSFVRLCREFDMKSGEEDVLEGTYPKDRYPDIGYRTVQRLVASNREFDAIFCVTDAVALGALKALEESGIPVPEKVAVIGCDNVNIARMLKPALTTIDVKIERVCKDYIKYILSDEQSVNISYQSELVVRETL